MYELLDRYQKEAYGNLLKIADRFNGAFLCDGVGLGKTFVGLMLIERLVLRDRKKVVVFADSFVGLEIAKFLTENFFDDIIHVVVENENSYSTERLLQCPLDLQRMMQRRKL